MSLENGKKLKFSLSYCNLLFTFVQLKAKHYKLSTMAQTPKKHKVGIFSRSTSCCTYFTREHQHQSLLPSKTSHWIQC